VGSEDVAAPPAKSEAIVSAARHGTLHVVPHVGHALTIEDAAGTESDVRRALGSAF
jgi:pimeloyl-ACP methyl ester carboxylesterase